ncbi:MAG: hypothetical protein ABH857_02270 [Elusimicrobiota bacterium]
MKKILTVIITLSILTGWVGSQEIENLGTVVMEKVVTKKILIAAGASEYKDRLVARIVNAYPSPKYEVKIVDLKALREVNTDDLDAIVLMNTCKMWKINGDVKKFLKSLFPEQEKKVILITTAGDEGWKAKDVNVDAITAASVFENLDETEKVIIDKINQNIQ